MRLQRSATTRNGTGVIGAPPRSAVAPMAVATRHPCPALLLGCLSGRVAQARSGSAAAEASSAAGQAARAPERASESIDLSKSTTRSPENQSSPSEPPSEGGDLAAADVPDADRPRASTKRALLIG